MIFDAKTYYHGDVADVRFVTRRVEDEEKQFMVVQLSIPDPERQGIDLPDKPSTGQADALKFARVKRVATAEFSDDKGATIEAAFSVQWWIKDLTWHPQASLRCLNILIETPLTAEASRYFGAEFSYRVDFRLSDQQGELELDGEPGGEETTEVTLSTRSQKVTLNQGTHAKIRDVLAGMRQRPDPGKPCQAAGKPRRAQNTPPPAITLPGGVENAPERL